MPWGRLPKLAGEISTGELPHAIVAIVIFLKQVFLVFSYVSFIVNTLAIFYETCIATILVSQECRFLRSQCEIKCTFQIPPRNAVSLISLKKKKNIKRGVA